MDHRDSSYVSHRKRRSIASGFGTVVTTALAAYGTYHIALWAWNTWTGDQNTVHNDNDNKNTQHQNSCGLNRSMRRNELPRHMKRCRREIATVLAAFGKLLRTKIDEATDTSLYRKQLKEIRKLHSVDSTCKHQESILWMTIQVETVTRCIVMTYAYSILFTALTIQVHMIGNCMYRKIDISNENKSQEYKSGDHEEDLEFDSQRALLESFDIFMERGGLDDLLSCVRLSVQAAIKNWNIHDPIFALQMNVSHLDDAISQIRADIEKDNLLQRYIIIDVEDNSLLDTVKSDNMLLNEMYDMLESPFANDAMKESLNCTFAILREQYIIPIFQSTNDATAVGTTVATSTTPLPNVISHIKSITNSFIDRGDMYISAMEKLPTIKEVTNICFCS